MAFIIIHYRLVNMLYWTQNDTKTVWKTIQHVRKNFITGNPSAECLNDRTSTITLVNVKTVIDNVEKDLSFDKTYFTNSYEPQEFLKDDILQMGAEMYTYLSFCPPIKLIEFYEKLLLEGQTKDIVLGLTNMIKTRRNAERSSAKMVWENFEKRLKHLKYKKIYSVFHNEKSSEYQEKCDKQNCLDDLEILGSKETFYYSP